MREGKIKDQIPRQLAARRLIIVCDYNKQLYNAGKLTIMW
jgi:hypothetical protein